jgi:hypothetical protein
MAGGLMGGMLVNMYFKSILGCRSRVIDGSSFDSI